MRTPTFRFTGFSAVSIVASKLVSNVNVAPLLGAYIIIAVKFGGAFVSLLCRLFVTPRNLFLLGWRFIGSPHLLSDDSCTNLPLRMHTERLHASSLPLCSLARESLLLQREPQPQSSESTHRVCTHLYTYALLIRRPLSEHPSTV